MTGPIIYDGWLMVPYSGPDTDIIDIGVSAIVGVSPEGREWRPAFLDYHAGQRVAKIRMGHAQAHSFEVYSRINGVIMRKAGKVHV